MCREDTKGFYELGQKLKAIRIHFGMTQKEIAKKFHVSSGYIGNIEQGHVSISVYILTSYAKLSHLTFDQILNNDLERKEPKRQDMELTTIFSSFSNEEKRKIIQILNLLTET